MQQKAILLDLDGTLWNTTTQVAPAWGQVLEKHPAFIGTMTQARMQACMGKTMEEIMAYLMPGVPLAESVPLGQACCQAEQAYLRAHGAPLYDGLRQTLGALCNQYALALVSNCQSGYLDAFLDYFGFADLFDDWETYGATGLPKSENIRLVVQRNGYRGAVYVGDTQGDCDAARKAGVPFIHAAYGFGQVDAADAVIDALTDLPAAARALLG